MKTLELPPGSAYELTLSLSAPTTHRAKAVATCPRSMRPYLKSSHRPTIADWSDKSMCNLPAYGDLLNHTHGHLLVVFMKHITQRHPASSATHITDTATGRRAREQHPSHLLNSVLAEESLPHVTSRPSIIDYEAEDHPVITILSRILDHSNLYLSRLITFK